MVWSTWRTLTKILKKAANTETGNWKPETEIEIYFSGLPSPVFGLPSNINLMKYLLTLVFAFSLTSLLAQSQTVTDFREQHNTSQDFYLYPSTLRMVNLEKNPDAYRLVNNVEKLQILMFERSSVDHSDVQQLRQGIREEDYEELISFQEKDSQITVYARGDDRELDGVVGVVDNQQTLALIDLAGFIDLPSLMNLLQGDYDFAAVSSLVNMAVEVSEDYDEDDGDEDEQ